MKIYYPVYAIEQVRYGTRLAPTGVAWEAGDELTIVVGADGKRSVYRGRGVEETERYGNLRYTYHPGEIVELDGRKI